MKRLTLSSFCFIISSAAMAHPGPLDANGGHLDHKTLEYHCHEEPCVSSPIEQSIQTSHPVVFGIGVVILALGFVYLVSKVKKNGLFKKISFSNKT